MRNALLTSVHRYDVVHVHSVFLYPTFAAARVAHYSRVPYVISPRGMLVPELIEAKARWTKMAWLRLIERRNFSGAAAIHFTTEREGIDALRTKMPIPASFIVPNGIALSGAPALSPARDDNTILFLGRISWKKAIDRLIAAMPHVDERARLLVAGNDDENLTPRLHELAERLGVANRVEFLGPVNGDAKEALLSSAAIFALASMSENFGNAVLEAMAAGTPVVVTAEVGLSDEVRRSHAGIVAPSQPIELANAINALLRNPEERRAMGESGQRAVERFRWPRIAAEMEAHYAGLLR
jgi:glycosyltransferase involved in cell wall biosynthesis